MSKRTETFSKKKRVIIILSSLFMLLLVSVSLIHVILGIQEKNEPTNAVSDLKAEDSFAQKQIDSAADNKKESNDTTESEKKKERPLVDYDDIKSLNKSFNNQDKKAAEDNVTGETKKSKQDTGQANENNSPSVGNSTEGATTNGKKSVTIDESSETIKDTTIQNEYKGEKSQGPINFFDVKPEKGADVNGDVPAGGKQNVGKWN